MKRIIAAAIRYNGQVYSLPAPARHHHVVRHILQITGIEYLGENEQGFIDCEGRFLDRREALVIARQSGQILENGAPILSELYSENVW